LKYARVVLWVARVVFIVITVGSVEIDSMILMSKQLKFM